ncbi:AHH domain-containing protein [Paenibacillus macerans]|uniref:AHH domain-containing protein n=1 Tax=Paenibacillus macerans TaxID=44252 RepID=UPI002DB7FBED|nr:AHH domain-containing protein [Paenibacillus macerans]MEC0154508.1 AHH domain-containing protein [Paenibacillus macerans]
MAATTDNVITYGQLKMIWPYGALRLVGVELCHTAGEHARLSIQGSADPAVEETILRQTSPDDLIELWHTDDAGQDQPLFKGQLYDIEISKAMDRLNIKLAAVSHSFKLDTTLRNRSFQHVGQSYVEVIRQVIGGYPGADMIDEAFAKRATGRFILQYQETDWSFLQRLASHAGAVLVPNITAHRIQFWVGLPQGRRRLKLENVPLVYERKMIPLASLSAANEASAGEEVIRHTGYTFEWPEILQLGDEVECGGVTFAIYKRTARMRQGVLTWSYECGRPEGLIVPKKYNSTVIGAAIEGKILQISRNQVRIHLDMDERQDPKDAQWFPYAAEGSQVWYMMPEIGSRIKLYFPSADEDEAMVIQSVRMEPAPAFKPVVGGAGRALPAESLPESPADKYERKMQDPGVKSFGNPQGKEIVLGDADLLISAQEDTLYIGMNQTGGVRLQSSQKINVSTSKSLFLRAGQIRVEGTDGLDVEAKNSKAQHNESAEFSAQKVELAGSLHQTYERLLSPFEQVLKEKGAAYAVGEVALNNIGATLKGEWDGAVDFVKGLWNTASDISDVLLTQQFGDPLVRSYYGLFTDEEVKPLAERNETVKSAIHTGQYVLEAVTFQKSVPELLHDGGETLKEFVNPLVKWWNNGLPNPLTDREDESYKIGYDSIETAGLAVDIGLTAAGGAGVAKKAASMLKAKSAAGRALGNAEMGAAGAAGGLGLAGKMKSLFTDEHGTPKLGDGKLKTGSFKSLEQAAEAFEEILEGLSISLPVWMSGMGGRRLGFAGNGGGGLGRHFEVEYNNDYRKHHGGGGDERKDRGNKERQEEERRRREEEKKEKEAEGTGNNQRLIPGSPGVVTGGNSTKLGKNMMEEMGLKRSQKWSGYQAQHVIPSEMKDHAVIKKIGMDFDHASNGVFLRVPDNQISPMARHQGYHSVYNEVVERALNRMDINESVDVLQKQVFDLQKNLRYLQEKGLPLYPNQGATVELWERKLSQLMK